MTLDEAIKHCEERAEELRESAALWKDLADEKGLDLPSDYEPCLQCAEEHEQLAEWLTQLKRLKEAYEADYQIDDLIEVCLDIWG